MQKLIGILVSNNVAVIPHDHHLNWEANEKERERERKGDDKQNNKDGFC